MPCRPDANMEGQVKLDVGQLNASSELSGRCVCSEKFGGEECAGSAPYRICRIIRFHMSLLFCHL